MKGVEFALLRESACPEIKPLWVLDWTQHLKQTGKMFDNQTVAFYEQPTPEPQGTYRACECIFVSRRNPHKGFSMSVFFLN